MPQAPSRSTVADKDHITERRNYVLREMWQNGYLDEATFRREEALPLVWGGDLSRVNEELVEEHVR